MSRAVDVAELTACLARRGERLDEAAALNLGADVARALGDAHAMIDAEGNLAPVVHGNLGAGEVLVNEDGAVSVVNLGRREVNLGRPEVNLGRPGGVACSRATPRDDVFALGSLLQQLLEGSRDADLRAAIAAATEPRIDRRKITCVELEAWLSRSLDREAGRRALANAVRAYFTGRDETQPLSAGARVGVAAMTAAFVFGAGSLLIERCAR